MNTSWQMHIHVHKKENVEVFKNQSFRISTVGTRDAAQRWGADLAPTRPQA